MLAALLRAARTAFTGAAMRELKVNRSGKILSAPVESVKIVLFLIICCSGREERW